MVDLIKGIVWILSAQPLKNYRTKILQVIMAAWGAAYAGGYLEQFGIDGKMFGVVLALLSAAASGTAAAHKR